MAVVITRDGNGRQTYNKDDIRHNLEEVCDFAEDLEAGTPETALPKGAVADDAIDSEKLLQEEMEAWFPAGADGGNFVLDDSAGAAAAQLGTTDQAQFKVINFDANSGDSDDIVFFHFFVPQDYKANTLALDLVWTHTDADNSTEVVTWIATANAVKPNASTLEAVDAAGTAVTTDLVTTLTAASAGKLYSNSLDVEVEDIEAGDLVTVKLVLDASATDLDAGEHVQLIGINARWTKEEAA